MEYREVNSSKLGFKPKSNKNEDRNKGATVI